MTGESGAAGTGDARRDVLRREIGQQVMAVHHAARGALRRMAASLSPELQPVGYAVLRVVLDRDGSDDDGSGDGGVRAAEIGQLLGVDKSAVSRQVAQLEELGLIERVPDPLDGRASLLVPGRSAHSGVEAARAQLREEYAGIFDDWDDADLAAFAALLARFVAAAEAVRSAD
ncbi:MAG: MarR family transcriptional regulator [Microbacteriaceae bacterium]